MTRTFHTNLAGKGRSGHCTDTPWQGELRLMQLRRKCRNSAKRVAAHCMTNATGSAVGGHGGRVALRRSLVVAAAGRGTFCGDSAAPVREAAVQRAEVKERSLGSSGKAARSGSRRTGTGGDCRHRPLLRASGNGGACGNCSMRHRWHSVPLNCRRGGCRRGADLA